ncbi:MAG TPA: TIGR03118 family protein [Bryocella sp.]|nr:TIGR03118 family protein [Bryocella sp.]
MPSRMHTSQAFRMGWIAALAILAIALLALPVAAQSYQATILTSDIANISNNTDPNLGNPWGLAASSSGPWWVNDNNTGLATLYNGSGVPQSLVVTIPSWTGSGTGAPSGMVFNGTSDFQLATGDPAFFIFDTEDGTIQGWNPSVNPNTAIIEVNNFGSAVYKGLALASANGANYLYAANFFAGTVDVFDRTFAPHSFGTNSFVDTTIPAGYAPFNVELIGNNLVVTYAKQDAQKMDDTPGPGFGYVDIFDTQGNLVRRLPHIVQMNAPWAIVLAPANFGAFSNALLIGNFGSGSIMAFNATTGQFIGLVLDPALLPMRIDSLWALEFGNGGSAGPTNVLFYTAGTFSETYGTFGTITPVSGQGVANPPQLSRKGRN